VVEHPLRKRVVGGSNPSVGTKFQKHFFKIVARVAHKAGGNSQSVEIVWLFYDAVVSYEEAMVLPKKSPVLRTRL
jgi:hypothetical protein